MELNLSPRVRAILLAAAAFLAAAAGVVTLTWPDGNAAEVTAPGDRATRDDSSTTSTSTSTSSTGASSTGASSTSVAPESESESESGSTPPATSPSITPPSSGAGPSDRPVRVKVPDLGIDAPVILLGLDQNQALEVPGNATDTGWWTGGSVPGTVGPAVLAGHVNYKGQAGVFQEIGRMEPGDRVEVTLDDGTAAAFVVDRVEQHPKDAFPTDAVYGPTPGSELRLVTCGGDFDDSSDSYDDNIIVYARAV